jgi:hypothetical protein
VLAAVLERALDGTGEFFVHPNPLLVAVGADNLVTGQRLTVFAARIFHGLAHASSINVGVGHGAPPRRNRFGLDRSPYTRGREIGQKWGIWFTSLAETKVDVSPEAFSGETPVSPESLF